MIKVMYGKKGIGKTKVLVETANNLASDSTGDVVFIDYSNQLMYNLRHEVRFINISEFPVESASDFLSFICGIIAEDYDIRTIFIDGLTCIIKESEACLEKFFIALQQVSEKYKIEFYISMNGEAENMPQFIKEFVA